MILADFIEAASTQYSLTRAPIAIGFSNGAIMAAALLLTRPGLLAGAILFRPLSPFRDDLPASLNGTPVLIIDGEKDSRRSPGDGARLAERLTRAGAAVSHHVLPVGHSIAARDREIAQVAGDGRRVTVAAGVTAPQRNLILELSRPAASAGHPPPSESIWKEHIPITIWTGWTGEIEHPALGVDLGCPTASAAGLLPLGT